jgi:hypothetical protein
MAKPGTCLASPSSSNQGAAGNRRHAARSHPDTQLSVAALFLLMYRSVNVNARAELDEIFNSDAVINYLKQEG